MTVVTAKQIKAARALLDWSQEDLADKSCLSLSTIRNLEMSFTPRSSTSKVVCNTIQNAGIEFLDGEGIRRHVEDIKIYKDNNSCDKFFDDILHTISQKGGDVISLSHTQETFAQSLGLYHQNDAYRLEGLTKLTAVKCILIESAPHQFPLPSVEIRFATERFITPSYFYVFGNKYAIVQKKDGEHFQFVVFTMLQQAEVYRSYFLGLWNRAAPTSSSH